MRRCHSWVQRTLDETLLGEEGMDGQPLMLFFFLIKEDKVIARMGGKCGD